jgi:hypothetical protein
MMLSSLSPRSHAASSSGPRYAVPGTEELIDETGAALFPQLVWAHYRGEHKLHSDGGADPALEEAYRRSCPSFSGKRVAWSKATGPPAPLPPAR